MISALAIATLLASILGFWILANRVEKTDGGGFDSADKIQKFHTLPVPRVSGLILFPACTISLIILKHLQSSADFGLLYSLSAFPVLIAGLYDDVSGHLKPIIRLIAAALAAGIFIYFAESIIGNFGIDILDWLTSNVLVALTLTMLTIVTVTNGYNLIDGFNGLSAATAVVFLFGIGVIAYQNSAPSYGYYSLIFGIPLIAFLYFNFPSGSVFLGDGGAYFIGFVNVCMSISVASLPQVSSMAVFLLCAYPITETAFSFFRKLFTPGKHPFSPDDRHLHMLVFRVLEIYFIKKKLNVSRYMNFINSTVTVVMLPFIILPTVFSIFMFSNSLCMFWFFLVWAGFYCLIYFVIAQFLRKIQEKYTL